MASADDPSSAQRTPTGASEPSASTPSQSSEVTEAPRRKARIRRLFSTAGDLARIVYRDPEHVSERFTLHVINRHGDGSREWAESVRRAHPDKPVGNIAEDLRVRSAEIARIDGAISGTPILFALVPGYLVYLLQEARMTLRIAALYGRDPRSLQTAAETLVLRQVHPDLETAKAALSSISNKAMPEKPEHRRSLRTWVHSVYLLLVFGGFMGPSSAAPKQGWRDKAKTVLSVLVGVGIWVLTWVVPFTFMILMAWGCETHARQLGRRAIAFYGPEHESLSAAISVADERQDRGHNKRAILRTVLLFVSIAIPLGIIAYADHVRKTTGVNWIVWLGGLLAISLVVATAIISARNEDRS